MEEKKNNEVGSGALREAAERLLPFIWESNFDEEVETAYERAVVALRAALSLSSPIEPREHDKTDLGHVHTIAEAQASSEIREALEAAANVRYTVKQYVYNQGNDPSGNNQNQKAELREIEKTLPREAQDAIRALAPSRQGAGDNPDHYGLDRPRQGATK